MSKLGRSSSGRLAQGGATAIEFALTMLFVFIPLMLGIVDFSRWLFAYNSAVEATRVGARVAVVCDKNSPAIKNRMMAFLPGGINPVTQISVSYNPPSCDAVSTSCRSVTVALSNASIAPLAWFLPFALPLPKARTTLPTEVMRSVIDGSSNPQCT